MGMTCPCWKGMTFHPGTHGHMLVRIHNCISWSSLSHSCLTHHHAGHSPPTSGVDTFPWPMSKTNWSLLFSPKISAQLIHYVGNRPWTIGTQCERGSRCPPVPTAPGDQRQLNSRITATLTSGDSQVPHWVATPLTSPMVKRKQWQTQPELCEADCHLNTGPLRPTSH